MARKPRLQYQGAFYHVMARGNHRQEVFLKAEDYQKYRNRLVAYRERHGCTLYAYALMPNHVHLLIEQGETPLSKIMQGLQQSYTMYFNKKYGTSGHLFQGRYKAIVCDREAYLLELIRYIHLNPVRSGMVDQPGDYVWSSHRAYLEGRALDWLDVEMPLACLASTRKKAVSAYREFIQAGLKTGHREDLYAVKDQCYLGDDGFLTRVQRRLPPEKPIQLPVDLEMDELVSEVSRAFEVSVERITGPSRSRDAALCRAATAYVAREVGEVPLGEVAGYLGRDPASISIGIKKLGERLKEDLGLAEGIDRVVRKMRRDREGKKQNIKV